MKIELLMYRNKFDDDLLRGRTGKAINISNLKNLIKSSVGINYKEKYGSFSAYINAVMSLVSSGVCSKRNSSALRYRLSIVDPNMFDFTTIEINEEYIQILYSFMASSWYLTDEEYHIVMSDILELFIEAVYQCATREKSVSFPFIPINAKVGIIKNLDREFYNKHIELMACGVSPKDTGFSDIHKAMSRVDSAMNMYSDLDYIHVSRDATENFSDTMKKFTKCTVSNLITYYKNNQEDFCNMFTEDVASKCIRNLDRITQSKGILLMYFIVKCIGYEFFEIHYDEYLKNRISDIYSIKNLKDEARFYRRESEKIRRSLVNVRESVWIAYKDKKEADIVIEDMSSIIHKICTYLSNMANDCNMRLKEGDEETKRLKRKFVSDILSDAIDKEVSIELLFGECENPLVGREKIKEMAKEEFPDKYDKYCNLMEAKKSSKFAILMTRTKNFGEKILSGASDVELLVEFPFMVKDHKPNIAKSALDTLSSTGCKDIVIEIKKWERKHMKLFKPYSKQEFLDMIFIVGGHEFSEEEKNSAFEFIRENKLPYSLYIYKEVCKYLKDKEGGMK